MAAVATVAPAAVMAASTADMRAAAATTVASAAAMADKFYVRPSCAFGFFVEDVERRQADIRDFFLAESDLIAISGVWRRHIRCQPTRDCGRAACE
jgi:hypothetical protein